MTIEQAAREYIRLRRLKLDMKDHRNGLHAECDDDGCGCPDYCHCSGGHGRGCCVFTVRDENGEPDKGEWCDLCLESDVAHEWFLLASRQAAVALRRLEREVNRAPSEL